MIAPFHLKKNPNHPIQKSPIHPSKSPKPKKNGLLLRADSKVISIKPRSAIWNDTYPT